MMMLDSLPTDVLCDIFIALKGVHPARELAQPLQAGEFEADGNLHLARLGWLVITFVNQRWRSIALELAILWSRLPTHLGSEWLQIFVSRSKGTALTYIDMGRRAKGTAVQAREDIFTSVLPANMYRMRKIRLSFLPRHLPIGAALSHPAPLLEEFAISGDLRIDTLVFAGQAPRLRALILSPWCSYSEQPGSLLSLDTQPTVLSGLTLLRLSCNGDVPPVHTVMGILRLTTQLEILCITDMVASREAPPFEPTIACSDALPAHLPALKGCSLYGRIDHITHLVTHLRLPLYVEMSIDCDCSPLAYHPDSSVLRQLLKGLAAWRSGYENGHGEPFRVAHLESNENGTATLTFATQSAAGAASPFAISHDTFTLSLKRFLDSRDPETRPTIYSNVFPILFSHGETLLVHAEGSYGISLRQHLRCRLPRLRQIACQLLDFAVLGPDFDLLPSLTVLHLINPSPFNEAMKEWLSDASRRTDPSAPFIQWESLRSVLRERRAAGMGLERLVIQEDISAFGSELSNRYATVEEFMEDVIKIEIVQSTKHFWDA